MYKRFSKRIFCCKLFYEWSYRMKRNRIVIIIICVLFLGGILGLIKSLIPGLEHFDYRYLLTKTSTYETGEKPVYAVIYSIIMAILELSCICVLVSYKKKTFKIVLLVLCINALGCFIAVCMGDLLAIISLLIRVVAIGYIRQVYLRFPQ